MRRVEIAILVTTMVGKKFIALHLHYTTRGTHKDITATRVWRVGQSSDRKCDLYHGEIGEATRIIQDCLEQLPSLEEAPGFITDNIR